MFCDAGKILSGVNCVDCPAGKYCEGLGKNATCPVGTFSASAGARYEHALWARYSTLFGLSADSSYFGH